MQVRGTGQETPFKTADTAPAGTGEGWIRQRVPSQRSVSAVLFPVVPVLNPAAVQARADAHDKPISPLLTEAPAGLGVDPAHRSLDAARPGSGVRPPL